MTIDDLIKNSECFGVAYDGTCNECRVCDVKWRCEQRTREFNETPIKPEEIELIEAEDIEFEEFDINPSKTKKLKNKEKRPKKRKNKTPEEEFNNEDTLEDVETPIGDTKKIVDPTWESQESENSTNKSLSEKPIQSETNEPLVDIVISSTPNKANERRLKKSKRKSSDDLPPTTNEPSSGIKFSELSTTEIENLVVEHGGKLSDFNMFTIPSIRRMRMVSFIKSRM